MPDRLRQIMRESLVFQFGGKEFAVQPGDVGDRDSFRTFRFAGAGVGASPESEFVHLGDHRFGAAAASTRPCGSLANDETRAATNSIAEPFLQVATQAPQPMQAAASMLSSASGFGIGIVLASGHAAGIDRNETAGLQDLVVGATVYGQVLDYRKARERHGSIVMVSPSLNLRMCNWQVVMSVSGPCA